MSWHILADGILVKIPPTLAMELDERFTPPLYFFDHFVRL